MKSTRSLRSSAAFEGFVLDQLAGLGPVSSRKMFGGIGVYCGSAFFAIIARDELYLKVDADTRGDYEEAGMHAFRPFVDRPPSTTYYCVPVGVLESGPELIAWARKAVAVATRGGGTGTTGRRRSRSGSRHQ
jgi:DNA transformation protein and related proteins